MPTTLREGGFQGKINNDNHEPMHVRVWHQRDLLVINFERAIRVWGNYGFNRNEARRPVTVGASDNDLSILNFPKLSVSSVDLRERVRVYLR